MVVNIYRITGNFCGFGLKRRHLIFADFFFCGLKISALKKKFCITGSNNRSDVTKKKNGAHYSDPNSLVTASEYAFG